jgi:hypothetical protein
MSDAPVTVDIHSLETFARHVRAELEGNVVPNATSIQGRLAGEGSYNPAYDGYQGPPEYGIGENRTFGVDPRLDWAHMIGMRHMDCEKSVRDLLNSLMKGMGAIADAAEAIAADYGSVDARNAMDVRRIGGYFTDTSKPPAVADGGAGDDDPGAKV